MKDRVVLLLCAVALAHGVDQDLNRQQCNCDPSEAQQICEANYGSNIVQIAHENCDKFYKCAQGKPVAFTCQGNLLYDPVLGICNWPHAVDCGDRPISDGTDSADPDCDDNTGGDNDNGAGNDNDGTCNCDPSEAPSICAADGSNGVFVAHENCNQFYLCANGRPEALVCSAGLLYNPFIRDCDWPHNVECGDRVIPKPDDNPVTDNNNGGNDNDNNDGTCNCNPEEAPSICAAPGSEGVLVAHENCNQYYICNYGKPVAFLCPGKLLFNPYNRECDWPQNVDCGDRFVPEPENNCPSCNGGDDSDDIDDLPLPGDDIDNVPPQGDDGGNDIDDLPPQGDAGNDNDGGNSPGSDNGGNDNVGGGNCDPNEAPAICAAEDSDDVLVAHENCNKYYICDGGKPIPRPCPGNLLFNPETDQCDWPENVDCGDRVIPDPDDGDSGNDNGGSDNGGNDNGGSDNGGTDNGGSDNGGNDVVGGGNCDPNEAPAICAAEDSDDVLVAHENCNKYYICDGGKPIPRPCPGNLLFNPETDQCDWPENVDCGDRVIPNPDDGDSGNDNGGSDNGGNDNGGSDNGGTDNGGSDNGGNDVVGGGNCDPSEAPAICAADDSDDVLVAHENCNKYYICHGGNPVPRPCPGNLSFNPNTDQCDWPENVDCGDRVIPDPDDGDSGNDNSGSDNGDGDNGGSDNGGNDVVGGGNCDPSEAPAICAADDSNDVLVAHENCNKYYICHGGKPIPRPCPGNLLFNPDTDQCDWPENVDCGDRVIPDPEDGDSGNDNGGSDNGDGDNGGSDNGGSDNGGSDNGGNGVVGGGNCDPSEAPTICAADDSDDVLVAHENCNKYYICHGGKPVSRPCPGNLLFNPNTDQCDWPENVDCGDRVIPDPDDGDSGNDNGGSDNGDGDNGGSDNGGSDNGGNGVVGSGNCDPSEAPTICAADDSDDVLVAHENCNKYYICHGGKPVSRPCPGNLLFNPNTDQCDWPENVDCGDRVIPDPDDGDSGNDNGGSDNGGGDNGGSDNGGNGVVGGGNCDPSEAPAICAANDSDDVLVAHENCNKYYICHGGKPIPRPCPGNLLFNPITDQCDWPENVDCGDRVIPDPDDSDNGDGDNGGSDNGGNDVVGGGNCDPSEAPAICAADDSNDVLVAHENCNKYYICHGGKPIPRPCPGNLLFNPDTDQCDWPENVDCGDRVIPDPEDGDSGNDNGGSDNGDGDNGGSDNGGSDNGGSDNGGNGVVGGGNCDPSEAPTICAADDSDDVLVAHENCNKYYICHGGKPVSRPCPGNLLFNPNTDQCDWPENVDCGDRVIPDPDDGDSGNDNGGSDNGGGDNGGSDNGGNGIVGGGNCDPSEAPAICAANDSDDVLVAHENCNKYYICHGGKPIPRPCPGNLLFNPITDQCDWPENVDCGDRVIPDPDDSDNGNDNGGSDNGGSDNGGGDNGGSDNGGNDNGGICNCNPGEAPEICVAENSNGTLIAHENCDQYYICNHGKPVAMPCPENLLYNPFTEECDWPENVDCGDRNVPADDSDDNQNDIDDVPPAGDDSGSDIDDLPPVGDDPDNDNDGSDCNNDNNNNDEPCNCRPEDAPSICAVGGSDGAYIAHENCNQYYQCSNGRPVAQKCPSGLLYNPVTIACDWPHNVDCGDRVIPDPDEDNNVSESNEFEDGGNDNGSTCNCNPEEAPAICAVDGSSDVMIAHENCNQFYKCANGVPVAFKCSANLLYNPYKKDCDWPENVECGNRVIPDPDDDDNNDSGNDNDNGPGADDSQVINDDPSQAPSICADSGSDGVLVAHENCNQYYVCSAGRPVAMPCSTGLLFNPVIRGCDWPQNVVCGDRVVPDDDCACNPRNAPKLCAKPNSDGLLVAHEDCSQFYMCVAGVPVPRPCPSSLMFNADKTMCDWPQNVDCSNRMLPFASLNKHLESRQSLRK